MSSWERTFGQMEAQMRERIKLQKAKEEAAKFGEGPLANKGFKPTPRVFLEKRTEEKKSLDSELEPKSVAYLTACTDCDYIITVKTTKIVLDACKRVNLTVKTGCISGMIEIMHCEDVTLQIETPVPTITLDMTSGVLLYFRHLVCMENVWINQCARVRIAAPELWAPSAFEVDEGEESTFQPHKEQDGSEALVVFAVDEHQFERHRKTDPDLKNWGETQFRLRLNKDQRPILSTVKRTKQGYIVRDATEEAEIREAEKSLVAEAKGKKLQEGVEKWGGILFTDAAKKQGQEQVFGSV